MANIKAVALPVYYFLYGQQGRWVATSDKGPSWSLIVSKAKDVRMHTCPPIPVCQARRRPRGERETWWQRMTPPHQRSKGMRRRAILNKDKILCVRR